MLRAVTRLAAAALLLAGLSAPALPAGPSGFPPASARVLAASAVSASVTGTTAETVLATIVIPGGTLGPNGRLRVTTLWAVTANANIKAMRQRLGGLAGQQLALRNLSTSTQASDRWQTETANRSSEASQVTNHSASGGWASGSSGATSTVTSVDTSADQVLVITGQVNTATDTLTLDSYSVRLLRP